MSKIKALIAFGFIMVASGAHAADMALPPEPPPIDDEKMFEFGTNWYLRGDIGWSGIRKPSVNQSTVTDVFDALTNTVIQLGVQQSTPIAIGKPSGVLVGGFGVGYDFGFFRADLTFDGRTPQKFAGTGTCFMASQPTCDYSGKINAFTAMANAYIDLGKWNGFSPYVGAGIGTAYVGMKDVRTNDFFGPGLATGDVPTGKNWNFAWALMAGVSYDISRNMKIDVGYRYLNIGSVSTDSRTFTGIDPNNINQILVVNRQIDANKLAAHEIRAGFRYMLD